MIVSNMRNMNLANNLVPSKLELFLYGILTSIIVVIGNFGYFADQLFRETGSSSETIVEIIKLRASDAASVFDNISIAAAGSVFLFWSLAGIIVFSILQSVMNVSAELKNDVDVSTHFLHPRNYTTAKFWTDVLSQLATHIILYVIFISWLILMAVMTAPLAIEMSQYFFTEINVLNTIIFASAFILLYICVIIFATLAKLLLKRKHIEI